MRTPFFILLIAVASTAAAQELDKDTQTRIRAERSAGGTGKISPEETANANVGAGPHSARPGAAARRVPREELEEQPAAGGASGGDRRGDSVKSEDARRDTRRP